jgi:lysophospholipase L1-like esterase
LLPAIVLVTTTFHVQAAPPTLYPIYFLGDSLTAGRAATSPAHTYRQLLLAHLRENPHLSVSEGGVWQSGWRVADALAAVVDSPPQAATALIIVEIGTNDATGNQGIAQVTDPAEFAADYVQLIAYLQAEAPRAKIICLSTWWSMYLSTAYDSTIERYCPHGNYVDITKLYAEAVYHGPAGLEENWYRPGRLTDSFHPNDQGMAAIARKIEARL